MESALGSICLPAADWYVCKAKPVFDSFSQRCNQFEFFIFFYLVLCVEEWACQDYTILQHFGDPDNFFTAG